MHVIICNIYPVVIIIIQFKDEEECSSFDFYSRLLTYNCLMKNSLINYFELCAVFIVIIHFITVTMVII